MKRIEYGFVICLHYENNNNIRVVIGWLTPDGIFKFGKKNENGRHLGNKGVMQTADSVLDFTYNNKKTNLACFLIEK